MRVVVLTESPGADEITRDFLEAAESFNRGLDIRLRFLDVGFELRTVATRPDEPPPAPLVEETISRFRPAVLLALGGDESVLECVAAAAKAEVPVAYLLPAEIDGPSAAIARIAEIVVFGEGEAPATARKDAVALRLPSGKVPGAALVDILVRSVRERRS